MLKIFRKIRQNLLFKNKISSYLLYAIGEISLVMIGILLALQVNNWNEDRKIKNELNNILKTVSLDLVRDTLAANTIIEFYTENEENSMKIINQEINRNNFKECPKCLGLTSRYLSFSVQTKGYEMLKKFSNQNSVKSDTLITRITQFYGPLIQVLEDSNDFIKKEVLDNIEAYKTKSWFVDWIQGKKNDEMIVYFTESEEYRKQVASHLLLAVKNHKLFVESYLNGAKKIIEKINERFENKKQWMDLIL